MKPKPALAYGFCVVTDAEKEIQRAVILESQGAPSLGWTQSIQVSLPLLTNRRERLR